MRKIERLVIYMDFKGLNDNKVTQECGLSQGLLGQARSGKSDLGTKAIEKILNKYQDLSRIWLITGEGEMLKSSINQEGEHNTQVIGDGNHINTPSTIDAALQEIAAQRKLVERAYDLIEVQININKEQNEKYLSIIDNLLKK